MIRNIIFSLISLFVLACKPKIENVSVVFDTAYFPIEINSWKIYQVMQITIDEATNVYDTVEYQLKEVFNDWYVDSEGDSLAVIKRFIRDNELVKWQETGTWWAGLKDNKVLQTEENIKYIKLNFPVTLGKTWDGNAYNAQDTLNTYLYEYTTIDSIENYNNLNFDRVLTVTQKNKTTLIDKLYFIEKYQYNLGLIYKEQLDLYDDSVEFGIPLEQRVSKGTFYYQTILDYGKN